MNNSNAELFHRVDRLKEALYASAYDALGAGRLSDAQRQFGLMLAIAPQDYRAWTGVAVCRERVSDFAMAANCYGIGGRLSPSSPWCNIGEARTRLELGDEIEAERLLDRAEALTQDPLALNTIRDLRSQL